MNYFYKGQLVELIENQLFNTHWNFWMQVEGRRVIRSGQPGIDLFQEGEVPALPELKQAEILPLHSAQQSDQVKMQPGEKVNINSATFSLIRKAMPGLGRVGAKKLVDNRPEGGYQSFEQLKEINADLQTNWEVVQGSITF